MTDAGCALAEKLETVTGDSLSPVASSTVPFATDSSQSPSSSYSVDLTHGRNLSLLTAEVSKKSKVVQRVCIDVKASGDLHGESANYYPSVTSVRKRKEEEVKPRSVWCLK